MDFLNMIRKNKKAFTLMELLIVITIIGILATLVIPRFTGQTEKARVAEAIGILSAMRRGQEVYFNENGFYLTINFTGGSGSFAQNTDQNLWAQIGMQPPQSTFWSFATRPSGTTGLAEARRLGGTAGQGLNCAVPNPWGRIALSFNPGTADPYGSSGGCYNAVTGPYHPQA